MNPWCTAINKKKRILKDKIKNEASENNLKFIWSLKQYDSKWWEKIGWQKGVCRRKPRQEELKVEPEQREARLEGSKIDDRGYEGIEKNM